MSDLFKRISNLPKTNKFISSNEPNNYSKPNQILEVGLELLAQKIANEIVENLNKGMSPEIAASLPFKKYSELFKPFLTETLADCLGNRILFHLKILVAIFLTQYDL
ncbi:hypothetical protein C7H19_23715 [Aphanothece hegewaldii CCALA 016]|uniref:Uncharacterized protein n=1 Tax=Aphanothece hegewaldii CCALA 016 TaxID=2107694 RepID=A0A2T1LRA5_9CHRO|nr:hypothetical protein [Aphanothece hegewaldii]PSF30523.1 hypothetical protein C7H19_23715 [Aphanothece hegewaldii CCALA 016]